VTLTPTPPPRGDLISKQTPSATGVHWVVRRFRVTDRCGATLYLCLFFTLEKIMNWQELQAEAKKIVANVPTGDFKDKTFSTGSGGMKVMDGLPIVHKASDFAYHTTANGPAYRTSVTIRCRDTRATDAKNRAIYECENGTLFTFCYRCGSPESFDFGWIESPVMHIAAVG